MKIARQQMIPPDLQQHPRPSDREIYLKPCHTAHLERGVDMGDNGGTPS